MNRKRIQQLKMKSLIIKKHDVDDEFDESYELSTEEDLIVNKVESNLTNTLFSKPGAYIVISFLIFLCLYVALDNMEHHHKRHHSHKSTDRKSKTE